jgi:DHA1 family tetracycline resistance protein-like MFS transporter
MGTTVAALAKNETSLERKTVAIVFLTVFLDLIGFGILIPIQPFFALSFGASPSVITLLSASYSLMQFIFVPWWGRASDRFGRRPVMFISIATSALGFFIFAFAQSLSLLFLSRMLAGLGSANIGCAQAMIADVSSKAKRTQGMALISAAMGLGFIVGPILGAAFSKDGFMVAAIVAGSLSTLNLFLALIFLKETRWLRKNTRNAQSSQGQFLLDLRKSNNYQNIMWLFSLSFLIIMAFSLFEQSIGMYLYEHFGTKSSYDNSIHQTALLLTLCAIVSAGIQLTLLKKLAERFGERRLLSFGTFLATLGLAFMPLAAQFSVFSWFFLPSMVFVIGFSLCSPALSSLISQAVSSDDQGLALGRSQSLSALGRVIGPASCGLLFEWSSELPFLVASLGMLGCCIMTLKLEAVDS